ncbi:fimbrillin family protein [Parabacteroides goldsteinii]|jgi:hypothetical protein
MRKLNLYTLTALLATCAGCTDSLPDNGEPSSSALQLVSVGLAETIQTRGIVTSINQVKLYVANADALTAYNTSTPTLLFTQSNGSWSSTASVEITTANGSADVYACYPDVDITSGSNLTIPVSVRKGSDSDETQQLDFTGSQQTDYLYATKQAGITQTNRAISLTMNHALAKVSFRIDKETDVSESLYLKQISIQSNTNKLQVGEGSMQLTDGVLNGLVSTSVVTLNGSKELSTSLSSPNVSCLMAPMSATESVLSFSLTVAVGSEGSTELRTFKTASATPVQWQAGKHYMYSITVNKIGGILKNFKVEDWKSDASQDTNIGI